MKELRFRDIGNYELKPMACYIKKFTPDFFMGMHNHPYFEMMYAAKGNFNVEIMRSQQPEDIRTVTVHQGELMFLDAYRFHRLQITEDEVFIYNLELIPQPNERDEQFGINTLYAVSYAALIERTNLKKLAFAPDGFLVVPNLSRIDSTMRDLIYVMMNDNIRIEDVCILRAHILMLFMEISKSLEAAEQTGIHYIKKIQLYIKHHLNQKICLDDIANEVGYHKSYVATQFKLHTGKTIMQTVSEMRIAKSLRLLRDTGIPVCEIAKQVGFPSYAQMVHEFNKSVGMPPSACRKVFQNDEMHYDSPQYSSIAIRITEEDNLLDDTSFINAFYKKNIHSKSKELINY